ncbi:phage-related HNH endonuclease [Lacticaseibacillus paracasei subsp. paracasei Lpp70]|nr:phage-related HNH endonuclease [Lacticaseibacillus paracasei subsp. paracasei Lpp70]
MAENETEIWKKHPDIDGIEVSSFGRVRSVEGHYYKNNPDRCGYMLVHFRINGKSVSKLVHRLIAETFIPNPDNLPQVNHKNCDRRDNRVSNLEWCDNSYNQKYRSKHGISNTETLGHPVFAINLSTLEVSRFPSQHEASRKLGVFQQNINAVISGIYKQTHGYWFVNADDKAVTIVRDELKLLEDEK